MRLVSLLSVINYTSATLIQHHFRFDVTTNTSYIELHFPTTPSNTTSILLYPTTIEPHSNIQGLVLAEHATSLNYEEKALTVCTEEHTRQEWSICHTRRVGEFVYRVDEGYENSVLQLFVQSQSVRVNVRTAGVYSMVIFQEGEGASIDVRIVERHSYGLGSFYTVLEVQRLCFQGGVTAVFMLVVLCSAWVSSKGSLRARLTGNLRFDLLLLCVIKLVFDVGLKLVYYHRIRTREDPSMAFDLKTFSDFVYPYLCLLVLIKINFGIFGYHSPRTVYRWIKSTGMDFPAFKEVLRGVVGCLIVPLLRREAWTTWSRLLNDVALLTWFYDFPCVAGVCYAFYGGRASQRLLAKSQKLYQYYEDIAAASTMLPGIVAGMFSLLYGGVVLMVPALGVSPELLDLDPPGALCFLKVVKQCGMFICLMLTLGASLIHGFEETAVITEVLYG